MPIQNEYAVNPALAWQKSVILREHCHPDTAVYSQPQADQAASLWARRATACNKARSSVDCKS